MTRFRLGSYSVVMGVTAASLIFFTPRAVAQVSPKPSAAPLNNGLSVSWPTHIEISPASTVNFNRFNKDVGSIIVSVKCDGSKSAIIPPTPDIDDALRSSLKDFVQAAQVAISANCRDEVFLVGFHIPSGTMTEVEVQPPR